MRNNIVEVLERRQLLAVTINNGLPQTDPNYYQAIIGAGGEPSKIMWENRNVLFEYSALLDLGKNNAVGGSQVVQLSSFGTDAVAGSTSGTATSVVRLVLDDNAPNNPNDNPVITINVTVAIPDGETRLVTSYAFSSSGYDLKTAHFFQYWDCVSGDVTSDFVKIRGTVAADDLQLRTYNTQSYNYSILQDGDRTPNATLTGFGVGLYPVYKPVITAGGYTAPATGDIRIPAGNYPGLGAGYGPVPYAVPVLQYGFNSSTTATVNTSLTQAPAEMIPHMEVNWLAGGTETPVPDGSVLRDPMIGVDFGVWGNTRWYTIRNSGRGDLMLDGDPIIQITGPNADAFQVVRAPLARIPGGSVTLFAIQYTPTQGGTQTATVTITSNDLEVTPYTFQVFGGSGLGVPTDVYDNDGPNAVDTDPDWQTQFQLAKARAHPISTQGAGQVHSISAQSDVDWVSFDLVDTSDVVIETFAPVGDMRVYLYDSAGRRLGYGNDNGATTSARITYRNLPGGPGTTYYLRVDEMGDNALVPTYSLYVRAGAAAAMPPAQIAPQATGTATGGSYTTLVDLSAEWTAGEWIGRTVTITGGSGIGKSFVVTAMAKSNPTNSWYDTLVFAPTDGFAPTSTTRYAIDRQLTIQASSPDDTVSVDVYLASLRVVIDANTYYFPLNAVDSIQVLGAASDSVHIGAGVPPVTVAANPAPVTALAMVAAPAAAGLNAAVVSGGSSTGSYVAGGGSGMIASGTSAILGSYGDDTLFGTGAGDVLTVA